MFNLPPHLNAPEAENALFYFPGAAGPPHSGFISSPPLHIALPLHLLPDAASDVVVTGELWKQADF